MAQVQNYSVQTYEDTSQRRRTEPTPTAEVTFQIHTLGQERKDFQKLDILPTEGIPRTLALQARES